MWQLYKKETEGTKTNMGTENLKRSDHGYEKSKCKSLTKIEGIILEKLPFDFS